jgi:hypothetical protein
MDSKEVEALLATMDYYLMAIKTAEDNWFDKAFYRDSVVINANVEDEEKANIPIQDFVNRIKQRHQEGMATEEVPLGYTVSFVGNVGNIRLDFKLIVGSQTLWGTDYFNLVKRDGRWKISQKIYYVTHSS